MMKNVLIILNNASRYYEGFPIQFDRLTVTGYIRLILCSFNKEKSISHDKIKTSYTKQMANQTQSDIKISVFVKQNYP